jgi:modulator of FtsH protease
LIGWGPFFAAQVGASAALAGLVFVGVSISLAAVLKYPHLPGRVLEAIAVLAGVLVISSLALVPEPTRALGAEVFVVGLAGWLMGDVVQVRWWRLTPVEYRAKPGRWMLAVLGQAATLPFPVAGALLLAGATEAGLGVVVAGVISSYLVALINAWVLLVEVHR